LNNRGVDNAFAYENATTSYIIKKCPYDPYSMNLVKTSYLGMVNNKKRKNKEFKSFL
jgi:hypothetical protein